MIAHPPRLDPLWPRIAAALAVIAATAFAYRGIGLNGFHYDDWPNILNHPAVQMWQLSADAVLTALREPFLSRRPIPSLTFAIDWWRGGGTPGAFLVTNLVLHIAAALAVLAFIARILAVSLKRSDPAIWLAAAGGTLWWALQPIHVQAVSYAVQRMTELAALFSILSVWAYLNARHGRRAQAIWGSASAAFLILAVLCKENAWITPALVMLSEYLLCRSGGPLLRHPIDRWALGLPIVAGLGLVLDVALDGPLTRWALYGYHERDFTMMERLLTQPKVVLFHVSQLLWPLPGRFSLEHDVEIVRSAASFHFWLPMAVILGWCAAGLHCARREGSRTAGFFMLWVPITLIIESSVVPLQLIFEHRMYLPAVGFAGLVGLALAHAGSQPRRMAFVAWTAVGTATLFSAWATAERIPQWRNDVTLYEQAVRAAPKSVGAWNQLALGYLEDGQLDRALQAINRAIEIEPRWGDGYPFVNRGVILEAMGQVERARQIYDQTIETFPRQVLGYNNRGLLSLRTNNAALALLDFERAVEVDPTYAPGWTNRGTAHLFLGNRAQAQSDFERAITLSPHEPIALHYLGELYAAQGRSQDAANARTQACRLGIEADCRTINPPPSSAR